jgi:predicted patatin/cPLA2 family phospholipase
MLNIYLVFYLSLFPFAFVYSQSGVDSACKLNLENVFKVHKLKIRYENVQYIYDKHGFVYLTSKNDWNRYFKLIKGFPLFEEQKDSISGVKTVISNIDSIKSAIESGEIKSVKVKILTEEELDRYIEQLNCTPKQAYKEYKDLIRNIKSEKEMYLKCINAEIAKGDSSKYKEALGELYGFHPPMHSVISLPRIMTKLNFLNVFKEFVLIDNEEILPAGWRVDVYLKCNCKIP